MIQKNSKPRIASRLFDCIDLFFCCVFFHRSVLQRHRGTQIDGGLFQRLDHIVDLYHAFRRDSLTHGQLFGWDNYKCNVELHSPLTYGMTVIYRNNFDGVVELENGEKVRVEVAEKDKNVWDMREFNREAVLSIVEERLSAKNGGAA